MYLPLGLELMSFWTDDEEAIQNNEKFDIPIPDESVGVKPIMFYSISHVKPNGPDMCYVSSDGEDFCINESYESVNSKIRNQTIYKLN